MLVRGPPKGVQLKLSDFGLAKNFRENAGFVGLTHQGDIGGSGGFLSPRPLPDFPEGQEAAANSTAPAPPSLLPPHVTLPFLPPHPPPRRNQGDDLEHPAGAPPGAPARCARRLR